MARQTIKLIYTVEVEADTPGQAMLELTDVPKAFTVGHEEGDYGGLVDLIARLEKVDA